MKVNEKLLYKLIGSKIRQVRIERDLKQAQLAKNVDVKRTSITNIEAGIQKLPISLLFEICEILRVEPTDILPPLNKVRLEGLEEVVIDPKIGKTELVPPQTATAVRDILASIEKQELK